MVRREPGEPYYRMSVAEASVMYSQDDATLIDVRRPDEYAEGHVKGALLNPVDDLLSRFDEIPRNKKVLFFCSQGVRSGLACEMAAAIGIDVENLYNVEDGTPTWIEHGHPTNYGSDP